MSESNGTYDEKDESVNSKVQEARQLYASQKYKECSEVLNDCLSDAASEKGRPYLAELHLMLAKCYRGLDNLKDAIVSCNSALEQRPGWKDPFLVRSACFQLLYTKLSETDGDLELNIDRDRKEADIIVDEKIKEHFIDETSGKITVNRIEDAFKAAKEGSKIFVEPGNYYINSRDDEEGKHFRPSVFLFGKNVLLIGASSKRCVLLFGSSSSDTPHSLSSASTGLGSNLETLLICASAGKIPTLIKRFTFRRSNNTICSSTGAKTRFLGVAGGSVHLEDCLFDAGGASSSACSSDVDAVYASSRICGALAKNYPPPSVIARFCIFDGCQSFGTFTVARGAGAVRNCYFRQKRSTSIAALDCAKVTAENSEFARSFGSDYTTSVEEQTISATNSDLTVNGCYIHHGIAEEDVFNQTLGDESTSELSNAPKISHGGSAIAITLRSVAKLNLNYICGSSTPSTFGLSSFSGISCMDSDMSAKRNLILNCSRNQLNPANYLNCNSNEREKNLSTLGLHTGIFIKKRAKLELVDNFIHRCDVGIYVGKDSNPLIKDNRVEASYFAGIFSECEAKPNVVGNTFNGGSKYCTSTLTSTNTQQAATSHSTKGLGLLWILKAGGLVGKNTFEDFDVSPIMIFSQCHPLLRDNCFDNVFVDEDKQQLVEKRLLEQFRADLFRNDQYFYMVDSEVNEKALQDVILKGPNECEEK